MIIEIIKDEFSNLEMAKERGFYKKIYKCSNCNSYIGKETYDKSRKFATNTIMKKNVFPEFCPYCGHRLEK